MRVLNRAANLNEKAEPLFCRERILITVVRDLHSFDQFHDEVRAAGFGRTRVENLRNIRMVHHRQRLAFSLKSSDNTVGIHPRFNNLERDSSVDGLLLFSHENDAASSLTNLLQQFVAADSIARLLASERSQLASNYHFRRRSFEKTAGLIMSQQ